MHRPREGEGHKEREATYGHDGTGSRIGLVRWRWKSSTGMRTQPDRFRKRDDVTVGASDLIRFEPKARSPKWPAAQHQCRIQYVGRGSRARAVPIFNLMEDAATPRFRVRKCGNGCAAQGVLDDGCKVTSRWSRR